MISKIFQIIVLFTFLTGGLKANTSFYEEGVNLYKNKKFSKAKFKFEQDIVFNPKSERSYLYLSKIFKKLDKKNLQEQNLNTVILLNPQNEKLIKMCNKFCEESKKLKLEIESLSKK